MTSPDRTAPLSAEQRDELLKLHEYDELIFGGFICVHCTPDDCDDPDDNVWWPCQPLRDAGVTDHEAVALIKARRADIEHKAAVKRVRELLAEVEQRGKDLATWQHVAGQHQAAMFDAQAERDRLHQGMRNLHARWTQRAVDNGDYYNRTAAKYEHGKAVAFDAAAQEIHELIGEKASAERGGA